MLESQRKVTEPEVYERLLNRLALALDALKTADRLRDERPVELELRGLSSAEFELIRAYLARSQREMQISMPGDRQQEMPRSAKIIWLKDQAPVKESVKVRSHQCK
ncbi:MULTISPECIES: hypothetical protein [Pseudomonas]|uniref:Uncharacterized protein n=1 Tax=Pseudomonas protegens TaxID=380021 RepID=A0A2T6GCQ1_9PSED|nr:MULTISPECIES: hypothetical protein [Pseudomonas]PUA41934.1 hypothetical protein C5U62_29250 [Pseudomonas protegens]RXU61317.1 hypothetical protein CW358_25530 [Pseudomonas protegens]ULT71534.1 hypothetical protein L1O02_03965 [Pseudomonas sp. BC42]BAQ77090.1 uncharacterized protein POS17_5396 [Pseudomonas sp. Os17]BAQ83281.1 uncharacterized protein PST29_5392 [Pseudomonas sp. St29]